MMSSVLGLMSVKCYRDLELGRAIGIEKYRRRKWPSLRRWLELEGGNRNTQAGRTGGQTRQDQEAKTRFVLVMEDDEKTEEAEPYETNRTKSGTTNKVLGSMEWGYQQRPKQLSS